MHFSRYLPDASGIAATPSRKFPGPRRRCPRTSRRPRILGVELTLPSEGSSKKISVYFREYTFIFSISRNTTSVQRFLQTTKRIQPSHPPKHPEPSQAAQNAELYRFFPFSNHLRSMLNSERPNVPALLERWGLRLVTSRLIRDLCKRHTHKLYRFPSPCVSD